MALDAYASYAQVLSAYEAALAASRRCLEWPDLPAWARDNARKMIALAYLSQGDFDACLATAQDALAQLRPGDPLAGLSDTVNLATVAAYLSGRWSELDRLQPTLALICDELWQAPGLHDAGVWTGYIAILAVALAREDRAATDAAAALLDRVLRHLKADTPVVRTIIAAYLADDPTRLDLDGRARLPRTYWYDVAHLAEHGLPAPAWMIQRLREIISHAFRLLAEIAEALACGDEARLAAAIEAAEAGHLVPLAAHMRIVLAQRTGDASLLEQTRPVLERLGDRQFLRRLEAVAATLG